MMDFQYGYLLLAILLSFNFGVHGDRENNPSDWPSLCKCAQPALKKMQEILNQYTTSSASSPHPEDLDDVIDKIRKIAHDCTSQPQCNCPDGYFKTESGYHCLKISDEAVGCDEAATVCSKDLNARLAVAKDHAKLTRLADDIRHVVGEDSEDYYWIGLSYNRTNAGLPVWTWEDGSAANYDITSTLKIPVKKSLVRIDLNGERRPIERVTISTDYSGQHWKQEQCGAVGRNSVMKKHKYICEFVMFNLEIKPVTTSQH